MRRPAACTGASTRKRRFGAGSCSAGSAGRTRGLPCSSATSTAPRTRSAPARARRFGRRPSIRIRSRGLPARPCCSKAGCSCRLPRSRSRSRDRPTTPAARSVAPCPPSIRPPAARSGRRTRFRTCRRSLGRIRGERTCSRRPAPASGSRPSWTSNGARCTSGPATPSRARQRRPTP